MEVIVNRLNLPTRYEIVASEKATGAQRFLVGYTRRLSRPGLLAVMRANAETIIARLEIGELEQVTWSTKPRPCATFGDRWEVKFTGRTQKEAQQAGELPHIAATVRT